MKRIYTVFAVYEDQKDHRYTAHVEAESPEQAEMLAVQNAPAGILVAGVAAGKIVAEDQAAIPNLTKIRGRGYTTTVAKVHVTFERIKLPLHCPTCKADLRKVDALQQLDVRTYIWAGRLPRETAEGDRGVPVNYDVGAVLGSPRDDTRGVNIRCASCTCALWNGFSEVRDTAALVSGG